MASALMDHPAEMDEPIRRQPPTEAHWCPRCLIAPKRHEPGELLALTKDEALQLAHIFHRLAAPWWLPPKT